MELRWLGLKSRMSISLPLRNWTVCSRIKPKCKCKFCRAVAYEIALALVVCRHQVKTQSRTQAMVKSTIKSLAGCMHAKAAIEALENLDGPQCRVMATWQLAEIPLGFYSAIIMWRLFGQDVAVRAGCSAGLVAHATAFHLSKHPAHVASGKQYPFGVLIFI